MPRRSTSQKRSWLPRTLLPEDTWACLSLATICAALFLIAGIDDAGIWDPHELDRAELARRIAVNLFGADLQVAGAQNGMPTLSDLGAGELGFTSMAAGFATWGLHEFAGRLPLALWSLAGVLAVFAFVARAFSARAGMFAAIALCTMPAYFVQARTMLGDAVTLAAFAMCFFGFAGALIDRQAKTAYAFLAMGVAGAACGFLSRGWLLGVTAPAVGVGLSWLAVLGTGQAQWRTRRRVVIGVTTLVLGAAGVWRGAAPLLAVGHGVREVTRELGVAVMFGPAPESTFDLTLRELGHGLFPWSAWLPLAFGLLVTQSGERRGPRTLLLVGAATAYGMHALLAPFTGPIAFVGVSVLAAIVGVGIDQLDRRPAMPIVGVGSLMILAVLLRDMLALPDKGLAAFAVPAAELPSGVADALRDYLLAAAAVFAVFVFLTALSPEPTHETGSVVVRIRRRLAHYERIVRDVSLVWAGNLAFGFLVVEAAFLGMGATLLIGRRLGWPTVTGMSRTWAYVGLNLWWFVPLTLVTAPLTVDVVRRVYAWLLGRLHAPRSFGMFLAALGAGGILCFGYYGAMAGQLSPKGALDAYASRHREGEPLGLLGVSSRLGHYYSRGDTTTSLSSPRMAMRWLATRPDGPVRWLAFRDAQLAELNALFRSANGHNLPMVSTGSGQVLLALSRSAADDENPLAPFVRSSTPTEIQHPVDALFGDQLRVLGWEVVDETGAVVSSVATGTPYRMRLFLRVERRISRNYRAFIHIDASSRRHNGDHEVVGGLYPMTFWNVGDHIVDEHAFTLEPNFSPGRYAVFFGYFIFDERLPVTEGRHHDNRLIGGALVVK